MESGSSVTRSAIASHSCEFTEVPIRMMPVADIDLQAFYEQDYHERSHKRLRRGIRALLNGGYNSQEEESLFVVDLSAPAPPATSAEEASTSGSQSDESSTGINVTFPSANSSGSQSLPGVSGDIQANHITFASTSGSQIGESSTGSNAALPSAPRWVGQLAKGFKAAPSPRIEHTTLVKVGGAPSAPPNPLGSSATSSGSHSLPVVSGDIQANHITFASTSGSQIGESSTGISATLPSASSSGSQIHERLPVLTGNIQARHIPFEHEVEAEMTVASGIIVHITCVCRSHYRILLTDTDAYIPINPPTGPTPDSCRPKLIWTDQSPNCFFVGLDCACGRGFVFMRGVESLFSCMV